MTLPKPGQAVRGSSTGRPIMAALDLLGRRWVLRIVWELRACPLTFRQLQERCDGMSPTVLNTRLRELRDSGIVASADIGGYALSESGAALLLALEPLMKWAGEWERSSAADAQLP